MFYTSFSREITMPQELLTIAGACGVEPRGTIRDISVNMTMKVRCARVLLPWFAFEHLDALSKYLWLKFGFMQAGHLPVFNFIMNEARPVFGAGVLPMDHENLFPVHPLSGLCSVYDDGHVQLNEWEAAFLSILCSLTYDARCTPAVANAIGVSRPLFDDALAIHNQPDEYLAFTLDILMEWYNQPKALQDKITLLQCAFVHVGLDAQFQLAMSMYGRFLYHFSPHTTECTPPPSLIGAQGGPVPNGEEVVNNPAINNPEIDIIEVIDDEPNANDPPHHIVHLQNLNLNPTVWLIRLPKK